MSKATGDSLAEYDWQQQVHRPSQPSFIKPLRPMSRTGMEKVLSQLGALISQLWQLRHDKIGSLFQEGHEAGRYSIGECLSPAFTWQQRASLDDIDRGPFKDDAAYFNASSPHTYPTQRHSHLRRTHSLLQFLTHPSTPAGTAIKPQSTGGTTL